MRLWIRSELPQEVLTGSSARFWRDRRLIISRIRVQNLHHYDGRVTILRCDAIEALLFDVWLFERGHDVCSYHVLIKETAAVFIMKLEPLAEHYQERPYGHEGHRHLEGSPR